MRFSRGSEALQTPDFGPFIADAVLDAELVTTGDPFSVDESVAAAYREKLLGKPDDYILYQEFVPRAYDIALSDPTHYLELVTQSVDMLRFLHPNVVIREGWAEEAVRHELWHAAGVTLWGGGQATSSLCVRFFKEPHPTLPGQTVYNFAPFHVASGPVRRVHGAMIAAMPPNMSGGDKKTVWAHGYDDYADLEARAEATPPVTKRWRAEPNSLDDELQAALEAAEAAETTGLIVPGRAQHRKLHLPRLLG